MILMAGAVAGGKLDTVRIVIADGNLRSPVVITDPAITSQIKVAAGPGHFRMTGGVRDPIVYAHGFIVDWSRGSAVVPKDATTYEVSFVMTRRVRNTYLVRYAIDAAGHGYVYFPAEGERGYEDNVFTILRGVEGGWFHAWSKWEGMVHPLIREALR